MPSFKTIGQRVEDVNWRVLARIHTQTYGDFFSSIAPKIVETDRSRESGRCVWGAFTALWVTARAAAGLLPTEMKGTMKVLSVDISRYPK